MVRLRFPLLFILIVAFAQVGLAQDPIRAKTEAGKEVILYPDGTWKYAGESEAKAKVPADPKKQFGSKTLFKPDRGSFGIWYDQTKWQMSPKSTEPGRWQFNLRRGDGYAIAIVEELPIPIASLRKIALENAKEASPDARIIAEESKLINGKEILCLTINGTVEQIPFTFYGYYYGGKQGTIQLLTFTGEALFEKYKPEFLDFLSGLEID